MANSTSQTDPLSDRLVVRTYAEADHPAIEHLYTNGLLAGQIAANDTGADIENIDEAYFQRETDHFWVADVEGKVVGMIGVAQDTQHKAEIRRLRVDREWQQTDMAERLLETALKHCKHHGFLKIVLDTRFDPDEALDLFDKVGFQHTRTKNTTDKDLLEFYLDLYRQPRDEENQ